MQPILPAPAGSILDLVARTWAAGQTAALAVRPTIRIGSATLVPVAMALRADAERHRQRERRAQGRRTPP
jgi:hypothetical protein